jgi:hypothetical protein
MIALRFLSDTFTNIPDPAFCRKNILLEKLGIGHGFYLVEFPSIKTGYWVIFHQICQLLGWFGQARLPWKNG